MPKIDADYCDDCGDPVRMNYRVVVPHPTNPDAEQVLFVCGTCWSARKRSEARRMGSARAATK